MTEEVQKSKQERIVAKYIELREQKRKLKQEYDATIAAINEDMQLLESAMNEFVPDGATSARFNSGTVVRTVSTTFSTGDWWALKNWASQTNNLQMFQNRFNDSAVAEYAATSGELPPGVLANSKYTITVRKR